MVGPLNATLLVDSQYGRSLAAPNLYYVTPDEQIYNYEAYARKFSLFFTIIEFKNFYEIECVIFIFKEISSLSSNTGSLLGGTYLTIEGIYLYTDPSVPADIRVGGK